MTARPLDHESRRRPLCIAVALVLMLVAVLLAAGCGAAGGDCPQVLSTVTITKLDSNGIVEWTKLLDTGMSNSIAGLVPTSDGGFVTAGSLSTGIQRHCVPNSLARIIRFTRSGEKLWDRNISETDGAMEIISMHDGGFAVLTGDSKIFRLDSEGKTLWRNSTGYVSMYGEPSTITETHDGGVIVAGPVLSKFDKDGTSLWKRSLKNQSLSGALVVDEIEGDGGYYIFSLTNERPTGIFKIKYDAEGFFENSSRIFNAEQINGHLLYNGPEGLELVYSDEKSEMMIVHLDNNGTLVERNKINGSWDMTLTRDHGYIYAESKNFLLEPRQLNPDGTINENAPMRWGLEIHVVKLNPDGSLSWNITLPHTNPPNLRVGQTIQTTDGGYVVVSENGVLKDLSMLIKT